MTQTLRGRLRHLMHRSSVLIALASALHGGTVFAQGAENNASTGVDVQVSGGKLSVDVRDASLAQVLRTIAQKADLALTLRGDFSAPVTHSFVDVPLREGLEWLARGHSLTLSYGAVAAEPGGAILTGIWVIDGGSASGPLAEVTSTQPALPFPSAAAANPSQARPSPPPDGTAEEHVANAALESTDTGPTQAIQALSDDVALGSADAVDALGDIAALDANPAVRRQAVAALGQFKGPEIEEVLTGALADVDTSVRARAVRGLRGSGTGSAVQSPPGALTDDPDPQVRFAAVRALTSLPGRTTLATLERALADPDPRVRGTAARGLSWWKVHLPAPD